MQVGHSGVTEGVVKATAAALLAHELIKVRLHEPEDKKGMAQAIADGTQAMLCGLIGHTAILYRPHPTRPRSLAQLANPNEKPNALGGQADKPSESPKKVAYKKRMTEKAAAKKLARG